MKIKVSLTDESRIALVFPIDCAALVAELLARGVVYERDGYYSTSGWKQPESGLSITYVQGDEFAPTHPKVIEAEQKAAKSNSDWYAEHTKRQAAEKEAATLRAQLETIQAMTVCTVTPPATDTTDADADVGTAGGETEEDAA